MKTMERKFSFLHFLMFSDISPSSTQGSKVSKLTVFRRFSVLSQFDCEFVLCSFIIASFCHFRLFFLHFCKYSFGLVFSVVFSLFL